MDTAGSDDDLITAWRNGQQIAFERLYQRYRQPLYRYLLYSCRDRNLADELFQDIWFRVINKRDRYRQGAGFKRYLFRIAHNRLVDHWRSVDRQPQTTDFNDQADLQPEIADNAEPEAVAANQQLKRQLEQALAQLPRAQREAFLLQQEAGLSLQDIATHTGTGRESVKSRLRYAVNKLRLQLAPSTQTPES